LQEWRKNILGGIDSPQAHLMNKVEKVMLDRELYGVWSRCDPLAAAILLVPDVATQVKEVYLSVELHGLKTRGAVVIDYLQKLRLKPNVTIIERVDLELYKNLLVEAFQPDMIKS
jgi:inosine-uridine nucleoside N-ribohydrolase